MSEEIQLNNAQYVMAQVLNSQTPMYYINCKDLASLMSDDAISTLINSMITSYREQVKSLQYELGAKEIQYGEISDQLAAERNECSEFRNTIEELTADINGKIAIIEDLNDRVIQLSEEAAMANSSNSHALNKALEYSEKAEKLYQAYKNLIISVFKKDRKALMDDATYQHIQDAMSVGWTSDIPGYFTNLDISDDIKERLRLEPDIISMFDKKTGEKPARKMTRLCPACNGKGEVTSPGGGKLTCPACGGHKRVSMEQWRALGGSNKPAKKKGGAKAYVAP
jgi:uncharacterized protein YoxC